MTKPLAPPPAPAKKVSGWPKGKKRGPKTPEERANSAPIRRSRLRTTNTDWVEVRNSYVRGTLPEGADATTPRQFQSLAQLAIQFGVAIGTIEGRSAAENWPEQRETFRSELQSREDKQLLERLAAQGARARIAYFGTALRGQQQIDRRLRNDELTDTSLQRLMGALRSSQQVADVAQGRPVDGPAGAVNNFWLSFTKDATPAVQAAFVTIDAEAQPPMGVVAAPGRS